MIRDLYRRAESSAGCSREHACAHALVHGSKYTTAVVALRAAVRRVLCSKLDLKWNQVFAPGLGCCLQTWINSGDYGLICSQCAQLESGPRQAVGEMALISVKTESLWQNFGRAGHKKAGVWCAPNMWSAVGGSDMHAATEPHLHSQTVSSGFKRISLVRE